MVTSPCPIQPCKNQPKLPSYYDAPKGRIQSESCISIIRGGLETIDCSSIKHTAELHNSQNDHKPIKSSDHAWALSISSGIIESARCGDGACAVLKVHFGESRRTFSIRAYSGKKKKKQERKTKERKNRPRRIIVVSFVVVVNVPACHCGLVRRSKLRDLARRVRLRPEVSVCRFIGVFSGPVPRVSGGCRSPCARPSSTKWHCCPSCAHHQSARVLWDSSDEQLFRGTYVH
ncbi:uncharacterized protein B0T23DRAFT_246346 [Neurospora hispaniola]|uniref:Uncharacterized protein n=1 Tax=Neurospora hispaniola TaxID=588809 RepID=A0AAJ0MMN7_9PEZI|nr:hypothetical protein B0T23DRAFT_246346 [Neurospora hispaniola]